MNRGKHPKIGLALGSGGARGWAHLGVIRALREAGVPVHAVAGTSMGSLVGAAFAAGRHEELQRVALELDWRRVLYFFMELNLPRNGLIDGAKIVDFIRRELVATNIEDLPMAYRAVAADVRTGEEVVLDRGDVVSAVRASISIPGMFTPVEYGERLLVDGGVVNPVPVTVLRNMGCDYIIAANISNRFTEPEPELEADMDQKPKDHGPPGEGHAWDGLMDSVRRRLRQVDIERLTAVKRWFSRPHTPNVFDILGDSFRVMETQLAAIQLENSPPELLIEPRLAGINFMEFHRAPEIIERGYLAARRTINSVADLPAEAW